MNPLVWAWRRHPLLSFCMVLFLAIREAQRAGLWMWPLLVGWLLFTMAMASLYVVAGQLSQDYIDSEGRRP